MTDHPALRLSFHLGGHKTATTHFQASLFKNRAHLRDAGVQYYPPRKLRGPGRNFDHRFGRKRPPGTDPQQILQQMAKGQGQIIFSDENLLGRVHNRKAPDVTLFYPRATAELKKFVRACPGHQIELFIAIRNTGDFYRSLYCQQLVSGRHISFENFIAQTHHKSARWFRVMTRFSKMPEVSRIFVWRYEDYPATVKTILSHMISPDLAEKVTLIGNRKNDSLSAEAIFQLFDHVARGLPMTRADAEKLRRQYPQSEEYPTFEPWTAAEQADSLRRYDKDIDRIAQMDKVTLITP
ncbi:hypothetical protein [Pseudaestuariivita rosea]|uniref:hypothetical protein n=1 Tax=Pseudaestuariivita rosea TaxID=2763263 RepID=UPI001ABB5820|nr:hypothetical protein [Pseudaestuariivita rosea]